MSHHHRDLPLGIYVLIGVSVVNFELFGPGTTVVVGLGTIILAMLAALVGHELRRRMIPPDPRKRVGRRDEQAVNTTATGGARS
ncbi:hypothetical protein ACFSX5_09415 [Devosia albogilva]|uniref:Uncharacterized protein n=1 Tax=Devosia albogilva TaxID=429726 RepID=A0ABW5QL00_9HYPH